MNRCIVHRGVTLVSLLTIAPAWSLSAAPVTLNCVLTDTVAQVGAENRSIAVVFDEATSELEAREGGRHYTFHNVSVSSISISGDVDDVGIAIDRSSLGMVFQRYGGGSTPTTIEFGQCRRDKPETNSP